jgi:hypothetical protein
MRNALYVGLSAVAGCMLLSGIALAGHTEPAKVKKAQFQLVNAFLPCFAPNDTNQSNGAPACSPALPVDTCSLSATGSGRLSAAKTGSASKNTQDIKFTAALSGLTAACENNQLCITISFRATSDDCSGGSCTLPDLNNVALDANASCCTVSGGKCKISTTLLTGAPGPFGKGKNSGIELLGCGLKTLFPFFGAPVMSCGLLLN